MFVNFFEFADRHHASSTYDLMLGQVRTSARNATRRTRRAHAACARGVRSPCEHGARRTIT
eukprot:3231772-Prymnesium_polylepis.1